MPVTIRRVKGGKTFYAVAVAATLGTDATGAPAVTGRGGVLDWTEDRARAGAFHDEVAKRVADYHEGRLNAGDLEFLDDKGKVRHRTAGALPKAPEPKANGAQKAGPDVAAMNLVADRDEFRRQAEALGAKLKEEQDYSEELIELNSGLERERDALAAKVKELEAIIAATK